MTVTVDRPLTVDVPRARAALLEVANQVATTLRQAGGPGQPIRGATWTVGEAASHLAFANHGLARIVGGEALTHGDGTVAGLAAANAAALAGDPERDPARLAQRLVAGAERFVANAAAADPDRLFTTPLGDMDAATMTTYMLVHQLMHGCAIATSLGRPLPVTPEHATLTLPFLAWVIPRRIDRAAAARIKATYKLRLRGGPTIHVRVDGSGATVTEAAPGRVDCTLYADPVAFLLVATRLAGQWGQIARGRLLTWGRRPWLALRFANLVDVP